MRAGMQSHICGHKVTLPDDDQALADVDSYVSDTADAPPADPARMPDDPQAEVEAAIAAEVWSK
jgi:hypothetical protein